MTDRYSRDEIFYYLSASLVFYLVPLLVLITYPPLVRYFGEVDSLLLSFHPNLFLTYNTTGILLDAYVIHLLAFIIFPKKSLSKDRLLEMYYFLLRFIAGNRQKPNAHQLVTFRFYCVKLFFVPMMLGFFLNHISAVIFQGSSLIFSLENGYPFLLTALFFSTSLLYFIDILCFLTGYTTESFKLKNVAISVDPFISGWVVCLLCYPPFNTLTANLFGSLYNLNGMYLYTPYLVFASVVGMALLVMYTKASVDLLFKCSNLTYRGMVTHGTYSLVRHPAYTAKVLSWTLFTIPFIKIDPWLIVTIIVWAGLYILRALTEERHIRLVSNGEYEQYMEKVPYRFIPYVI